MNSKQTIRFPLLEYIRKVSDNCEVRLSRALQHQDIDTGNSLWYHHFQGNGKNQEGLYQFLYGRIENGSHYYWTMINFETGEIAQRYCWGGEPSFYVVGDDLPTKP